jgi:hypothetical protein
MFYKHVVSQESDCVKVDETPYTVWRYGGNAFWNKAWDLVKNEEYKGLGVYKFTENNICQECIGENPNKELSKEKTCKGITIMLQNCRKRGTANAYTPCVFTGYPTVSATKSSEFSAEDRQANDL